ncbi:MAG: serine hydrolase domain-containing protein [Bauldia litoralis]|uniref:serine hydrolase domain-containing protein n=2 Tax=Bauldia litoralis TaxID=665467 RepID=UPI003299C296
MTVWLARTIVLAFAALGLGIGTDGGVRAEDRPSAPANAARLVAELEALVGNPDGPPGVIVIIQRGDDRAVYAAGLAEVGCADADWRSCEGSPPDIDDHMRIASVSKAFSGAVALALVSEGALSLDSPIGDVLPDLPAAWHPVTLAQLLNHTSGLPDYTASPGFGQQVGANPAQSLPPGELLAFVTDQPLNFAPGSDYRYSNSDNLVVALMAEAVTGDTYPAVLQDIVFDPLGLTRTSLRTELALPTPVLHGYLVEEGSPPEDVTEVIAFGSLAWASGGIVSTPHDLNRFVRADVGGRLFGAAEHDAQFTFREDAASSPPGPGGNAVGLGLFRYRTACGDVYGHTGSILGYTQLIAATADGLTSITFSVNAQMGEDMFPALRRAQEAAVCLALAD